jgi:hypothetical protein
MKTSGDTSSTGNHSASAGSRGYFKIPPVIDHQAGSFFADRLRLLGVLLGAVYRPRVWLVSLFVTAAAIALVLQFTPPDGLATPDTTPNTKPDSQTTTEFQRAPKTDPNPELKIQSQSAAPDAAALQAQLDTLDEKLRYTERKLAAALTQLRATASATTTATTADQQGQRAALMLALGTGAPYQALLGDIDPEWLGPEDMTLLRRYSGQGFYDANHLARRLTALLDGATPTPAALPPALAWLSRHAGDLLEVRPQAVTHLKDARLDILIALFADRPDEALRVVDAILHGQGAGPLRDWRDDLAVWNALAPLMARLRVAYADEAVFQRPPE